MLPSGKSTMTPSLLARAPFSNGAPAVKSKVYTLNQFTVAAPINVAAGDVIGLHLGGFAECLNPTVAGDTVGFSASPTPAVGGADVMTTQLAMTLNVSATVGAVTPPPPGDGGGDTQQSGDSQTGPADSAGPDRQK